MTALFFVCVVACIFVGVAMIESPDPAVKQLRAGYGLLSWLITGNWPAKVGGGLLIIGVGALLRYGLLHVDIAPNMKLASGAALSVMLFGVASLIRSRYGRHDVAVAVAGAAFGIAYLTAYSAYALFHYMDGFVGLALLAIVAVGAGAYAIVRNAMSLAVLAMFGAFLAPAFALDHATPALVYGYYIGVSQLTLIMVLQRGWRALIHLSFLFTLACGGFLAWTSGFYLPEHFATLYPLLVALVAIHVAMPLAEQRSPRSQWAKRFDVAYFIALPIASAASLLRIAPDTQAASGVLMNLGGLWLVAALATRVLRIDGLARHAAVGALLLALGAYLRSPTWPWFLIAEGVSVAALIASYKIHTARAYQDIIAGCTLIFAILFAAVTLGVTVSGAAFANHFVMERLVAASLLIVAGIFGRRNQHLLSAYLGWLGIIGLANTVAGELIRTHFDSWSILAHGVSITAALFMTISARRRAVSKLSLGALAVTIAGTALWASIDADVVSATVLAVIAPLALIVLALRSSARETDSIAGDRVLALVLVPVVTWIWTRAIDVPMNGGVEFTLSVAALSGVIAVMAARARRTLSENWIGSVVMTIGVALASTLFVFTLFHIQRGFWPIALDVICVGGLAILASIAASSARYAQTLYAAVAIGAALMIQALLLCVLGPHRVMTIADVLELKFPAVISLFWSGLGAALTLIARKVRSRALWSTGAAVLVACAAKLVLFDFGSFGELANIVAVIASGLVFLLVSWLAPLPPKEDASTPANLSSREAS